MTIEEITEFRARENAKGKEAIQAITDFYEGMTIQLTVKQEEIRQRLITIHALLLKGKTNGEIVKIIMKRFSISDEQVYRDIRNTAKVFGSINKAEKEGHRYILGEMMKKTRQKAIKAEDYAAAAKIETNLMKINGLDKEDQAEFDFDKLTPHNYEIILPPDLMDMFQKMLTNSPSLNLTQFMEGVRKNAEDAIIVNGESDQE